MFSIGSTDEETFSKLRLLHAEPDDFDLDSAVWIDRTATEGDASVPDPDGSITKAEFLDNYARTESVVEN